MYLIPDICVTFRQKRNSVDAKKNKLKSGESLKIEKKFKDLESASASRKSRSRKRSSSYTQDPCTPPKDAEVPDVPAGDVRTDSANGDATELDRMLVAADEDNYLKPQHETTPAGVRRKSYLC